MIGSEKWTKATGNISTGSTDLDRSIGGGIPYRTLMLIEGQSASGKSTLAQQLVWGALADGENAALYTTDQTVQSFLRQTESLGQDMSHYFLLNHLQIFPLTLPPGSIAPELLFRQLNKHISEQTSCRLVVVDSASGRTAYGRLQHRGGRINSGRTSRYWGWHCVSDRPG